MLQIYWSTRLGSGWLRRSLHFASPSLLLQSSGACKLLFSLLPPGILLCAPRLLRNLFPNDLLTSSEGRRLFTFRLLPSLLFTSCFLFASGLLFAPGLFLKSFPLRLFQSLLPLSLGLFLRLSSLLLLTSLFL